MTEKLYKSKVSYYETDCMNIVHHSNYIRYFEDARIQYMHDIGCDVAEMQSKGLYIPNVDAYARYKKPLKFGDEFSVEVSLVFFYGFKNDFLTIKSSTIKTENFLQQAEQHTALQLPS